MLAEIKAEIWITVYAVEKGVAAASAGTAKPAGRPKIARKSRLANRRKVSK
jgi:hypothetical protein